MLLGGSLAGALTLGGSFTSNFTLSGTPAQNVIDELKEKFPDASRGTAQAVFRTTDGKPFTEAQKNEIAELLSDTKNVRGVSGVLNPFETQATKDQAAQEFEDGLAAFEQAPADLDAGQKKIDDGLAQVSSGEAQLNASQAQITAGKAQLDSGQATLTSTRQQIDAAIAQLEAAAAPEAQIAPLRAQQQQLIAAQAELDAKRAELVAGQRQLDAGRAKLEASKVELRNGQAELDKARAELPEQAKKLDWGQALLNAAENYRTVSEDGSTAIATVLFEKPLIEVSQATQDGVVKALSTPIDGVQTELSKELVETLDGLLGPGEVIGLLIAAIVLVVMLGSLIAAGLPLLNALLGVGVSVLITLWLASVIEMNSTTPALGVMLGLAVGIDYSLFILNRHRRQLKQGMPMEHSIAMANGTSGSAVFFAGLTVMIALVALNLTGIGFLGVMGNVAAMSILISVFAALTLTPAMSRLIGQRVLSRRERKLLSGELVVPAEKLAKRAKRQDTEVFASKHPWLTIALSVLVLGVIALPAQSLRLGLPDGSSEPVDTTQYRAFKITAEEFGAGANGLVSAVVTLPEKPKENEQLRIEAALAQEFMTVDNVTAVVVGGTSENGQSILFAVKPSEGPASASTEQVVRDLRALAPELDREFDAKLGVTGLAAVNIDISQKLADALPLYLGVVLLLSMVLLMLVFRSILLPVIASAGFLLTVLASLGAVVAIYQWGWLSFIFDVHDPGPILSFLPTLLIGILFGLAMDYQLFIATGIREAYVHGDSARSAITHGVRTGRAVVIAAAVIMVSVFGSFAFGHLAMIKPLGFGLAVGILFDAFLVRLLLVPAVLRVFGSLAWKLPRWLDRIMPDMDVEGAKLEREHKELR